MIFLIKYAWVVLLKDKKRIAFTNDFQKFLDESGCNSNKISVDGSEFYNRSMKSWLQDNDTIKFVTVKLLRNANKSKFMYNG